MQINLNQSEIEQALKNYISDKGISLYGRIVTLAFTAGRKAAGLSAEVNIDEDPNFFDAIPSGPLNRVSMSEQYAMDKEAAQAEQMEPVPEVVVERVSEPLPSVAVEGAEVSVTTTSLFA